MSASSLAALHRLQAERYGPRTAVRWKQYGLFYDCTWDEYREQATACAAALIEAAVAPGDRVGILSENRLEWLIADMGILAAGAVNVPIHAPLSAGQVAFQLQHAEVGVLFVSNREQLAKIDAVRAELPLLRLVVMFASTPDEREDVVSWDRFLQRGRRVRDKHGAELSAREHALDRNSPATIMYTSGTTGNPKGVVLTHGNLLSNARAVNEACPRGQHDVLLNWLPLSHIYARTVDHYLSLVSGAVLCLAESPETVVDDIAQIHPTHIAGVPRFYEKILSAVAPLNEEQRKSALRRVFGNRLQWLSSGGAPLPPAVAHTYADAGLLLLQGYGLTESSPVISFNRPDAYKLETVGLPIPGVEVRIAEDGEVLTRGPHVMAGYWKNPQATAETIRDGWLYTGDLGSLDEEGYLSITGRKKELLVLSNGKKVVPSYLEGLLLADPCIDQIVVVGEGRSYLTALIVPNRDNIARENRDLTEGGLDEAQLTAWLLKRIDLRLQNVSSWERIRKIAVIEPLTMEKQELTVSLKLRREVIAEHYAAVIDRLYADQRIS